VPQGELFRAVQSGTLDAAQSDDDSAAAPVDVRVFGAYFPLASRYSLDVPALWHWHGLKEVWEEAYAEIPGVTWLSTGAWDPCNFGTTKPIKSLEDLKGLRVYTFPTGGQFLSRFGVVPVSLPYEDVAPAIQTGELDGVCWCGITEMHTVGWADVLKYFLTNPLSGAWAGSYFVNTDRWKAVPEHLQQLFMMSVDTSHYYRQHWYWAGEAKYRNEGKLELTTIPESEWKQVEDEASKFWDEVAGESPRAAKVVEIIKKYNQSMVKAGAPYRYS
jgi:TRAP-type mannitol/chloroaromatic compound transport system substrate-binding protein